MIFRECRTPKEQTLSTRPKTHEQKLAEAAAHFGPMADKLLVVLGKDGSHLFLALAIKSLERTHGRADTARMLRAAAMDFEDGGHSDANWN
jgi:hypothetical protein